MYTRSQVRGCNGCETKYHVTVTQDRSSLTSQHTFMIGLITQPMTSCCRCKRPLGESSTFLIKDMAAASGATAAVCQ